MSENNSIPTVSAVMYNIATGSFYLEKFFYHRSKGDMFSFAVQEFTDYEQATHAVVDYNQNKKLKKKFASFYNMERILAKAKNLENYETQMRDINLMNALNGKPINPVSNNTPTLSEVTSGVSDTEDNQGSDSSVVIANELNISTDNGDEITILMSSPAHITASLVDVIDDNKDEG